MACELRLALARAKQNQSQDDQAGVFTAKAEIAASKTFVGQIRERTAAIDELKIIPVQFSLGAWEQIISHPQHIVPAVYAKAITDLRRILKTDLTEEQRLAVTQWKQNLVPKLTQIKTSAQTTIQALSGAGRPSAGAQVIQDNLSMLNRNWSAFALTLRYSRFGLVAGYILYTLSRPNRLSLDSGQILTSYRSC